VREYFSGLKLLQFVLHKDFVPTPMLPQRIPYVDLTLVIDGKLHYRLNGEEITVKAGDAILFPKGAVRERLQAEGRATYASFNVAFSDEFSLPIFGRMKGALSEDTLLLLEKAEADLNRVTPSSTDKCKALFLYILFSVLELADGNENHHVEKIKQYVHDNISEPLSLSLISKKIHLVPGYVCALFKKEVGMTLTEYILRERISLAKRLIVTSQLSLSEICGQCGFSDYNYFSRSFKRITGKTAAFYKKSKFGEI